MKITNIPGYLPMIHNATLQEVFQRNATDLLGEGNVLVMPGRRNRGGSTDMGDLSHLMPVCHPYTAGAQGPGHSKDYLVTDYEAAVVNPAKIMAMVTIDLLADGGLLGQEIIRGHRPAMKKSEYLKSQRELAQIVEFDGAI